MQTCTLYAQNRKEAVRFPSSKQTWTESKKIPKQKTSSNSHSNLMNIKLLFPQRKRDNSNCFAPIHSSLWPAWPSSSTKQGHAPHRRCSCAAAVDTPLSGLVFAPKSSAQAPRRVHKQRRRCGTRLHQCTPRVEYLQLHLAQPQPSCGWSGGAGGRGAADVVVVRWQRRWRPPPPGASPSAPRRSCHPWKNFTNKLHLVLYAYKIS